MTNPDPADSTTAADVDPRTERTRRAIEEAARQLLDEGGPDAVTHVNVASTAHVSRTTVYNHWPSQADLLRDTIESLGKVMVGVDQLTGELRVDLDTRGVLS